METMSISSVCRGASDIQGVGNPYTVGGSAGRSVPDVEHSEHGVLGRKRSREGVNNIHPNVETVRARVKNAPTHLVFSR